MSQFTVPTKETARQEAKGIFENLESKLGMVPNLYAFIGHSPNALASYLEYQQSQAKGTFKAKEREAVYLAVSEVNGCQYCQAAHTALGKMNGFTEEETLQLRAGTHPDEKLNVISNLAAEIQRTKGKPAPELLQKFFDLGYDQTALVDLVALVSDKILANYLHNIAQFDIDFPKAQELKNAEVSA